MSKKNAQLNTVFDVVCRKLPQADVEFLMIGGHAVNFYGFGRATVDVDFMIVSDDIRAVRTIMVDAGFTNVSEHENVVFFNKPGDALRVDFLRVDAVTMATMLERAVKEDYGGYPIKLPSLSDLIAMKLFSSAHGHHTRGEKDLQDIAHLALEHELELETDLKTLCLKYGGETIYDQLKKIIMELGHA